MTADFSHGLAVFGIGIDLAEPSRLSQAALSPRFLQRVFSAEELRHFGGPPLEIIRLAEAFAFKEAFLKALGTGWSEGIGFHEVIGPPVADAGTLRLVGRAKLAAESRGICTIQAGVQSAGDVSLAVVLLFSR